MNKTSEEDSYLDVKFYSEPMPGVRYASGRTIYDEAFLDGQLIGKYWSPSGQIYPETRLPLDALRMAVAEGRFEVFRLGIEGEELKDGWRWVTVREQEDESGLRDEVGKAREVVIQLSHTKHPIDVRVCTRLDGSNWFVRWLEITNRGKKPTAISSVYPMSGRLWSHRYDEHIPLEIPSPFELAYYHHNEWCHEGDIWFEPLTGGTKTHNAGHSDGDGFRMPAFWVRDLANGQTFVCEFAFSGNWQFELNCQIDAPHKQVKLFFGMGLSAMEGEVLRVVEPGEIVRTPTVHIGNFQCDTDSIVQSLHRHIRHTVMPRPPTGREVEIEANHRGYLSDRENEFGLKEDIDVSAEVGVEMYVIDAGWYGNEPNRWQKNVGDWVAGPWLPNGLEPVREHARKRGMRFGLWVAIELIGANSTLLKEHPDWVLTQDGKPVVYGRILDLTKREVSLWVESEIERIIRLYDLDMFRIDYDPNPGGNCNRYSFKENTNWRYYETLYGIFDRMRAKFPHVVFQNCAGGGGRLDLGILQRFHNTELSDWMRLPRGLKILNGLTMSLPPEIGLRTFGTESGEDVLDADLDTQLRMVCLCKPIFRGIAPSLKELNPILKERIVHHIGLYKTFIRPLMKDCLVFHHTPWLPIKLPTPWCVLEYAAPDRTRTVVGLFRTAQIGENKYHFCPRGLDRGQEYCVTFDNTGEVITASGFQLVQDGIDVRLNNTMTSELLLIKTVETNQ